MMARHEFTKASQTRLIRDVRERLLTANCVAARWTAGVFTLRNKGAVHCAGFRIVGREDRECCLVKFEEQDTQEQFYLDWMPEARGRHLMRQYAVLARYRDALAPRRDRTFRVEVLQPLNGFPYLVVKRGVAQERAERSEAS